MNAQFYTEIFRLHIEHLHTLIERLSSDLATVDHALTTYDHPTYTSVILYMDGLGELSQHLADEVGRLQGFVQDLEAKRTTAKLVP